MSRPSCAARLGRKGGRAPDGQRYLMVKGSAPEAANRIDVVLNWLEEVKRRYIPSSALGP